MVVGGVWRIVEQPYFGVMRFDARVMHLADMVVDNPFSSSAVPRCPPTLHGSDGDKAAGPCCKHGSDSGGFLPLGEGSCHGRQTQG